MAYMSGFAFFGLMSKLDSILTTMEDEGKKTKLRELTEEIRKKCKEFKYAYSSQSAFSEFQMYFPFFDRRSEQQQNRVRIDVGVLTHLYLQRGTLTDDDTKFNINYENTDIAGLIQKIKARCDVFFTGLALDKKEVDARDLRRYMNDFVVHNSDGLDMPEPGGINEKFWLMAGAPLPPFKPRMQDSP